eukprot:CAMPEP_0115862760 /NCGR_PEP_ID=MMETSP0287-20121206/18343_1 /TAXON_ID=412157 /ORGANISM="Chrysochromulina rotalis, Strain UIO044" /LENGTH=465 /DNA_ID=CAMNT_0003317193 /DNA_START=47 /DNA_END=1444 /DNA_ORIENTATION=-
MGSGFLGVPAGILASGWLLGPAVLVIVTAMQWIAACQLAQVVTRAHALVLAKSASATLTPTLTPFAKALQPGSGATSNGGGSESVPALVLPSHTSYEIMLLCRLHLGRWAERVTMIAVGLYMIGCLWSFISVFSSSLTAVVPMPWLQAGEPCDIYKTEVYGGGCITLYYWWVLSFGFCMTILLALDLREQAAFQCAMTALRGMIILLMVSTLVLGEREDFGLEAVPTAAEEIPAVQWSGLPTMAPIGVFCQLFQIGVPSLLQPLGQKRDFAKIFGLALSATLFMYTVLGLTAVFVLGRDVDPSCNLNWQKHRSPTIALCVALFPALDCLSVFPLNAAFLANNAMACFFQRRWHAGELSRRTRYLCRLACCLPPFTCAFAFPSLAKALSFTGIVGIILPFIVTPLVHAASLAESRERWGTAAFDRAEQTAGYSIGAFSSPSFVSVFGIFGFMLLAYCVGCGVIFGF